MQAKVLALFAVLTFSLALSPLVPANAATPEEELKKLKQELQEMLQEMGRLRKEHAAEIEALKKKIAELSEAGVRETGQAEQIPEEDFEMLRLAAEAEAEREGGAEKALEETVFESGNLGLQALNPEISVTGDLLGTYYGGNDITRDWDSNFRGLGIHLEAYLDPYSRFKAAVPVNVSGAELGEAYFTRYGVLGNANITLGKFRQQFGVVNRWHKHGLDWFDFPLPLRMVFGDGGLNQIGASLDWSVSIGSVSQEIILQVTDGENPRIFAQNSKNRPSVLAHYKIYRDLSPSTYIELGGTGLVGWNDMWPRAGTGIQETLDAQVYGIDFTIAWEPTERMRYRNVEWRSELYFVNKSIHASDLSGVDRLRPWGGYTSFQMKLSRTVDLGTRFDYYEPDAKVYANLPGLSLFPLAVTDDDANRYLAGVYVNWFQSPFVKFRIGYEYQDGKGTGEELHMATFQVVFAAGPHKHERY